jgi:acyl transferase domain-containing protein/acyl carrier protein
MGASAHSDREESYRQALLKATGTIRQLLDENVALRKREAIAVIGMACRFPGGANDPELFWRLLRDGVDAITDVPPSRWPAGDHYDSDPNAPGKMYSVRGGFLDVPVADFDASFFGISPREARSLDPQHRLLLEISWEALEDASLDPTRLRNSKTGVFAGMSSDDYVQAHRHSGHREDIDAYSMLGSTFSTAVGRISYTYGFQGPCMALDTACSSSLVAVHLACQSLRSGESDLALAGGVNLILSPESHVCFSKLRAISPEGKCKTFDASADGYVRGEGCGVIVLKRLQAAIDDGNRVLAVIRGSAVNQDGKTNGLAAPNGAAQQVVIRRALEDASLEPAQIDYVEAHGTGTVLGDPIEVEALGAVFKGGREAPLRLGAVKTNIGHLEPAAGMAGIIKLILSLRHEELPASLHFERPNPHIAWNALPLRVVSERSAWQRSSRARIGGVSSFGFSGTNAHVIIEEAPPAEAGSEPAEIGSHLLCLSAREEPALRALAADHLARLSAHVPDAVRLADICHTAAAGRRHWPQRLAIEAADPADLQGKLTAFLDDRPEQGLVSGSCDDGADPELAFLFTGQGSQYAGMGRGLYQSRAVFRDAIDRCDTLLRPLLDRSLSELLFASPAETLSQTGFAQPVLFALEYALAELWLSWGVRPHALMGQSVGEYVAACVAGVFSLEDGIKLIAARGRLMQALPAGGRMAAVMAAPELVTAAVAPFGGRVGVAAVNGPRNVVISGEADAVDEVVASFAPDGVRTAALAVSHAFHSHLMEPMLRDFEHAARQVAFSAPRTTLISNVTGEAIGAEIASPRYWVDHIRRPVAFGAGMQTLLRQGMQVFVEIGPQATLLGMGRQNVAVTGTDEAVWLPSLQPNVPDMRALHRSLGALYVKGVPVDWPAVYAGRNCRWTTLPHYPFQRRRHWIDSPRIGGPASGLPSPPRLGPLLDRMTRSPLLGSILFETRFGVEELPLLADHRVFDKVVVAGACLMSMILSAAAEAFGEGTIELADVVLHQALVLPDDGARSVHLAFDREADGQASFRLVSIAADTETGLLHVSGKVQVLRSSALQPPHSFAAMMQRWEQLDTRMAGDEVYAAHRRRHIALGPSNLWLESLRLDATEAIGRFRLPRGDGVSVDRAGYRLHPGLLDSWLSLLVAIIGLDGPKPLVPFAVNRLSVVRAPQGERFWAYARRRTLSRTPDRLVGDMWLVDEAGELIAECLGLEGRATTAELLLRGGTKDLNSWFYQPQWIDAPSPRLTGTETTDDWLVFTDAGEYGTALVRRLRAEGCRAVTVVSASRFEQVAEDDYAIDPLQSGDMSVLLQSGFPARNRPFRVAYLWGLDAHAADAPSLEAGIAGACAPLLHLVAAVGRIGYASPPSLTVITKGAQPANTGAVPEPLEIAQAPLWGLCKTIALENPELACRCIDLDPARDASSIDFLLAELLSADHEDQIAERNERRRVARLAHYRPARWSSLPVRPDGSYLVCGGLGGLGRVMARELVARGARHLTLCGRHPDNPEAEAFTAELRRSGATVSVCGADLTRAQDVRRAIVTASADVPIRGIVHAAGVLDDGVLAQTTWEQFSRVSAVKTVGLYHLHEISRPLPLDFFIGFSSMVSLLGSSAQGAYVAANAFVDALMHARRSQGLPGLSINWGPWSDVGMAARLDEKQQHRLSRQGVMTLSPEDALQTLDRLWPDSPAQVGVMHVNWAALFQEFPGAAERPLLALLRPRSAQEIDLNPGARSSRGNWLEQLGQTTPSRRRAMLTTLVRDEILRVLGAGAEEQIAPRQPLFDLGMESLMAVELRNRLAAALACPLPTTLLFDYPTLEALVDHLCTLVPGLELAATPETSTADPPGGGDDEADALDELSEAELENMLAEKLRALAK